MFFCLGLALVVDGLDGPLAREFKVAEVLPRWSGETLDLVVDFTTYVFVPAYAIAASGQLPNALAIPAGILIVITGALYFARPRQMKTADNYFRGFPAVWNLAAFYLYLLEPPPWLAAAAVAALAGLTFAPIQIRASAAGQASAQVQRRAVGGLGRAGGDDRGIQSRSRPLRHLAAVVIAVYFFWPACRAISSCSQWSELSGRFPCHDPFS